MNFQPPIQEKKKKKNTQTGNTKSNLVTKPTPTQTSNTLAGNLGLIIDRWQFVSLMMFQWL